MPSETQSSPLRLALVFSVIAACSLVGPPRVAAVDLSQLAAQAPTLDQANELYNTGEYEEAAAYARSGRELDPWIADWALLEARSLMSLGRYEEAYQRIQSYVEQRSYDLRARLLLREAALRTDRATDARRQLEAIGYLINERSRRYGYDPESIVAVGEAALLFNIEPKIVLENFFRRAQQFDSPPVSAFLAAGNLALDKNDYRLASRAFQEGLESHPRRVELWHGLAQSFREGDRSKLMEYATKALQINPRHGPTLNLLAEFSLAGESYETATEQLNQALRTNPLDARALALKAALAFLRNENERGAELRRTALSSWSSNPEVDYLIGRELSKKYRFEDGAASQRLALMHDESYNPARIQLAQDLLRLGRNDEAWTFANAVHEDDPYDIAAYNLVTLKDKLQDFETLESEHFLVRLSREEAPVYGERALRVLEQAHAQLTERYGIELPQKTTVEIYPDPADFETRTFGMPGNPGFLGVCFGPVFTINSPATRSTNWEAVLYHEFCHTITLTMTNNRMPRWLSEGISVFEEQVHNPSWGQRMTAGYRDRILTGAMQPISEMSAAFLRAQTDEDVQFAYYQSYLVVEFIAQRYGLGAIKALLVDLGGGEPVNDALSTHLAPLPELDDAFVAFAKEQAAQLAPDFKFDAPDQPLATVVDLLQPKANYDEKLRRAREALAEEQWEDAIERLERLIEQAGYLPGEQNAHWPLAQAYRGLGDVERERETLAVIVQRETHRLGPITRLLQLAQERSDPEGAYRWSDAWLSINPMAETPWRALLRSAKTLDRDRAAVEAGQALVALEPPDLPSLHYQLAQLRAPSNPSAAKRHLLQALEHAPRFQDAYELYAELRNVAAAPPETAEPDHSPSPDVDPLHGLDLNYDFLNNN